MFSIWLFRVLRLWLKSLGHRRSFVILRHSNHELICYVSTIDSLAGYTDRAPVKYKVDISSFQLILPCGASAFAQRPSLRRSAKRASSSGMTWIFLTTVSTFSIQAAMPGIPEPQGFLKVLNFHIGK
jgi:hypothetical protein